MHVHGWLRLWDAMPLPHTTRPAATLCGECDAGWLDDDQGRVVKCPCRIPVAAQ